MTISRITNENRRPSYETISKIATTFINIDLQWLITGDGEILKENKGLSGSKTDNVEKKGLEEMCKDCLFYQKEIELRKDENFRLRKELDFLKEFCYKQEKKGDILRNCLKFK